MGDPQEDDDLFDAELGDFDADTLTHLDHHASQQDTRDRYARPDTDEHSREEDTGMGMDETDAPHPPSSDYGFDEGDVIDLDDPTANFASDAAPFLRAGSDMNSLAVQSKSVQPRQEPVAPHTGAVDSATVDLLNRRLVQLEQDHGRLRTTLDAAQTENLTKTGAIANLRSRNDQTVKEYEARIASISKQHGDELAKLRAEIRAAKESQQSLKTDNQFLAHEAAQERQRAKRSKPAAADSRTEPPIIVTPKKTKPMPFRDGFDDHEIINLSPTKPRDKKPSPHKAGSKRKRTAVESPMQGALDTPPRQESFDRPQQPAEDLERELLALAQLEIKDDHIRTLRDVLSHRARGQSQRTVEALGKLSYPGKPEATFQTVFMDSLSVLQPQDLRPTSVSVRSVCLDLWDCCFNASFWEPLPLILDLFEHMLGRERSDCRVILCENLLRLSSKTAARVAELRMPSSKQASIASANQAQNSMEEFAAEQAARYIDDMHVLRIIRSVAMSAALKPEPTLTFWTAFDFPFAVLMTHIQQPLPLIRITLDMLAVSVTDDSFGPRHGGDPTIRAQQERDLLERLPNLLSEKVPPQRQLRKPQPADEQDQTPEVPSREEIQAMRMDVLRVLRAISATDHGVSALAQHRYVTGQLTVFLCDQISSLYTMKSLLPVLPLPGPTELGQDSSPQSKPLTVRPALHMQTTSAINLAARILYDLHLFLSSSSSTSSSPDQTTGGGAGGGGGVVFFDKLDAVPGGYQKGLIALSRLAFGDRDMLLEAGVDEGAAEAAHEILDSALTPEDGEAVVLAMVGPSGIGPEDDDGAEGDGHAGDDMEVDHS